MTIFTPWLDHEDPAVLFESLIHAGLVEFVGDRYVRFERVDDPSRWPSPVWSLNAAVGNAEHPCISRLPLPWNVDSYSLWDDEGRELLKLLPPLIGEAAPGA